MYDRGQFYGDYPHCRLGAVLGEHLQTGHHQRPALAPYEEREVRGGARTRTDQLRKDGYGGKRDCPVVEVRGKR